ncbi:hypothetical protein BLS_009123 [Venturia inaequalis]|uniref:Glycosyl transferase CAP10 domain-containing protein n=1 Tax=Venturia inaequalis TaxID=5025 RepID=A0A8H3YN31_VENIN|nr:hypothetical protein BLS_009123 [Venturia inaequalis]
MFSRTFYTATVAVLVAVAAFGLANYHLITQLNVIHYLRSSLAPSTELSHPIDHLIKHASTLSSQHSQRKTSTLRATIAAYKERRNQPPPANFDKWYELAKRYEAILVEDFWDPIHEDLAPFKNLSSAKLHHVAMQATKDEEASGIDRFWIRGGVPGTNCLNSDECDGFMDMLKEVVEDAPWIPDVEIPFNTYVSPRIMHKSQVTEADNLQTSGDMRNTPVDLNSTVVWENTDDMTTLIQEACLPGSATSTTDFGPGQPEILIRKKYTDAHMPHGFVNDFEASKDICQQPDLLYLHGSLLAPSFNLVSRQLFPLFSAQKIKGVNPEIRIPSTLYWTEDNRYIASQKPKPSEWSKKRENVVWRGSNTGGRVSKSNWKSFHRHRFVTMTNASNIHAVEESGVCHFPWAMSEIMCHFLWKRGDRHALSRFVKAYLDIGFYAFGEWPNKVCSGNVEDVGCQHLQDAYEPVPGMSMDTMQNSKYLVDIDGNGYSARFRSFLLSTSVPIKATVFSEWHDARLIPWKHFIPMDNRFADFWGIMDYFLPGCLSDEGAKYSGKVNGRYCAGHDKEAESIGVGGAEWAGKVLRKEDMKLYMIRLLMEYGRLWHG